MRKINDYEVCGDYVIMYTAKYEPFLVSIEDFWKVKNITWHKTNNGYICNKSRNRSVILIHRIIMNCPNQSLVDHRNGDITNNIRDNLRIVNSEENSMNRKPLKSNTSGTTGVNYDKRRQKWYARIGVNFKVLYLGRYDKYEDAVKARKEAERRYYGIYSYDNSRNIGNEGDAM